MKISNALVGFTVLIIVLSALAAGIGLLYQDAGSAFTFTTLRGQTVQIYGQGLYHYDTPIAALGFRMADAVTLFLAIPLLVISLVLYRRGSLKGGLVLAGDLGYFLYNYASVAFGAAYNNLFLVYIILLAACLFAFVLALTSFEVKALPAHFTNRLPRRGIGIYLIISGVVLSLVWLLLIIIPALLQGQAPPEVWSYTTFMTGVIDLGVVAPALVAAGTMLLRRVPFGYLSSSAILVFTSVLGLNLTAGGIAQLDAGVVTLGQFLAFTSGFSVLTLFAIGFTVSLFRCLK